MDNSKIIRIATMAATFDLLSHHQLLANGGSWQIGVPSTGNATAARDQHHTMVSILDELLTIDLHQEYAVVTVHYQMQNSGSNTLQDFFFPVERWNDDLDEYKISIDGKPIKWEDVGFPKNKHQSLGEGASISTWKHSKIPFKKTQIHQVTINYKVRYFRDSGEISGDEDIGDSIFAYSLFPAATWNGPIQKGKIIVNVLHPRPEEVKILKPRDRFQKINDSEYQWNFENLTPTLDDGIQISVHEGYEEFDGYHLYKDRYYSFPDYEVAASSTLKFQGNSTDKSWGVPGSGIGEHLDLTVKNPLPLDAILIEPGNPSAWEDPDRMAEDLTFQTLEDKAGEEKRKENQKAAENWWNYNRVAQVTITLNDEYTFTATIPDDGIGNPYPIVIRGYSKPVKTIKLVIDKVYPGAKHKDTCISSIGLQAKLSKKPKLEPVR